MMKQDRISWIDELKGFLLLFVCVNHLTFSIPALHDVVQWFEPMRVPCFFFISGLLFSTRRHPNFTSYLRSKTKSLLIPYILLSELFLLTDPNLWDAGMYNDDGYYDKLHNTLPWLDAVWPDMPLTGWSYWGVNQLLIFLAGRSTTISEPLWFVFVLFEASLACYLINKSQKTKSALIVCSVLYYAIAHSEEAMLPLNLTKFLMATACLLAGTLCKPYVNNVLRNKGNHQIMKEVCALACLYAITVVFWKINGSLPTERLAFFAASVLGVSFLLGLFTLLERYDRLAIFRGICKVVAKNALVILPMHMVSKIWIKAFLQPHINNGLLPVLSIGLITLACICSIVIFRGPLHNLLMKERVGWKEALSA